MSTMLTKHEIEAQEAASRFSDVDFMKRNFPALFATEAHPKMSERYSFTHTYDVVKALQEKDYGITSIQRGNEQFGHLLVRMRHRQYIDTRRPDTDGAPELVIIDSHDGSKSLRLALGYIKFLCMNGCIAGDMIYNKRFRHNQRDLMSQVMLEVADINQYVDTLTRNVDEMRNYQTDIAERMRLADIATIQRFSDKRDESFKTHMRSKMLHRRRHGDTADDLHTVVNVIQENVMRGGLQYHSATNIRLKSKPINDVSRNVAINTALWNEATTIMQEAA